MANDAEAEPQPPTPSEPKLIGRSSIIELNSSNGDASVTDSAPRWPLAGEASVGDISAPSGVSPMESSANGRSAEDEEVGGHAASSSTPKGPTHGERILVGNRGAEIWWDADRKKWLVFDCDGMEHGKRIRKEEAEALAASLPGPPRHDGGGGGTFI